MNNYKITTRDFGAFEFFLDGNHVYVRRDYIDNTYGPCRLALQICKGGTFIGPTITATEETLKKVAYNWLRAFRRKNTIHWG